MEIGHYHFNVSVGNRPRGGRIDAPHKYEYISRSGRYAKLNQRRNSRNDQGEQLLYAANGNLPTWATDAAIFWRASQEFERKNGTQFREFEGSLPRGLTQQQQMALINGFIAEHFAKHVYSFAIHRKTQSDGLPAEHVHIMISERVLDGITRDPQQFFRRYNAKNPGAGGCKKDSMGSLPERLESFRASWAGHCNNALAAAGRPERVDHRSYRDRGIDLAPEKKLAGKSKRSLPATKRQEILAAREARHAFLGAHLHVHAMLEQSIMQNTLNYITNATSSNVDYINLDENTASGASGNVIYITSELNERAKLLQNEVEQLAAQPIESHALILAHRLQILAYEIQEAHPIPLRRRARHDQPDSDFDALTLVIEAIRKMINVILSRLGLAVIPPLFNQQPSPANAPSHGSVSLPQVANTSIEKRINPAAGQSHGTAHVDKPGIGHDSSRQPNAHDLLEVRLGQHPVHKRLIAQQKALAAREAEASALTRLYEARLAQASATTRPAVADEVKRSRLAEQSIRRKLHGVERKLAALRQQIRLEVEHENPPETEQFAEGHVEHRQHELLQTQLDELDQHEQLGHKDSHGPRPT